MPFQVVVGIIADLTRALRTARSIRLARRATVRLRCRVAAGLRPLLLQGPARGTRARLSCSLDARCIFDVPRSAERRSPSPTHLVKPATAACDRVDKPCASLDPCRTNFILSNTVRERVIGFRKIGVVAHRSLCCGLRTTILARITGYHRIRDRGCTGAILTCRASRLLLRRWYQPDTGYRT